MAQSIIIKIGLDTSEAKASAVSVGKQLTSAIDSTVGNVARKGVSVGNALTSGIADGIRNSYAKIQSAIDRLPQRIKEVSSAIEQNKQKFQDAGGAIIQVGAAITALGVGFVLLGKRAVDSAASLDKTRNLLIALEGSVTKANARLKQLQVLAQSSVGLTFQTASSGFSQLKAIGGIADQTINKLLKSIGKLNAAFTLDDQRGFLTNLTQIFQQGFERSDIKEAIGRVPIFEQLLESAFGTKDGEKLRQLKEAGKLTLETFLGGLSGAIASDPRLANIQESVGASFDKTIDRINNTALAPLGDAIIRAFTPIVDIAVPIIEGLSAAFNALPGPVQTTIVIVAALIAILGPLTIAVGGLMVALPSLVAGFAALNTAIATGGVLAGAAALITPIGIAVTALTVVVGVAAYAWGTYESAQEKASKVTVDSLDPLLRQIELFNQMKSDLGEVRAEFIRTEQGQQLVKDVTGNLDEATRNYISALDDEGKAQAINTEISR